MAQQDASENEYNSVVEEEDDESITDADDESIVGSDEEPAVDRRPRMLRNLDTDLGVGWDLTGSHMISAMMVAE